MMRPADDPLEPSFTAVRERSSRRGRGSTPAGRALTGGRFSDSQVPHSLAPVATENTAIDRIELSPLIALTMSSTRVGFQNPHIVCDQRFQRLPAFILDQAPEDRSTPDPAVNRLRGWRLRVWWMQLQRLDAAAVCCSAIVKKQLVLLACGVGSCAMRVDAHVRGQLARRFEVLLPYLNEHQQRLALATEARLLGHGGVRAVAEASGVSATTVRKGIAELESGEDSLPVGRARRAGGGRRRAYEHDPELAAALLRLVEPDERGDPMSPLRWTTKSLRHLAEELTRQGHPVSAPTVGRLLRDNGFSLQGNGQDAGGRAAPGSRRPVHATSTSRSRPTRLPASR